jgi:hypothetical protein
MTLRRAVISLIVCAGSLGAFGAAPALAFNDGIQGTVTAASTAAPVSGYEVDLYDASRSELQTTCTAPDGTYGFADLTPASYYVDFSGKSGCGAPSGLAPEWYNARFSSALAAPVSVTDGTTTTGIDASLADGSQITGTVTDASSGLPVGNVAVKVLDGLTGGVLETVCTASDGTYTAGSLDPGIDVVEFVSDGSCGAVGGYEIQFYNGAATLVAAAPVDVGTGTINGGVDARLLLGSTHALTVSSAGTGSGTIASSPAGISCPDTCAAAFDSGTSVTLTATPSSGSSFAGWSGGGCSGSGTCTVTVGADQSLTATFAASGSPPSSQPSGGGPVAPQLSGLKLQPASFAPRKHKTTKIGYSDTRAAVTTLTVERVLSGYKLAKHACKALKAGHERPTHSNKCTLVKLAGSFTHHDAAGANTITFNGKLRGHTLTAGAYLLEASPALNGLTGKTRTVRFHVA